MSAVEDWGRAYARQATADIGMWKRLQAISEVAECHRLQFLQMACEKLCKAHLCRAGADPVSLQSSHRYVEKNLPTVIRQFLSDHSRGHRAHLMRHFRQLSGEIELLSPAVDRGGQRLDNCEYPWQSGESIHVPADYRFSNLDLLTQPDGRMFLKCIGYAIERLA